MSSYNKEKNIMVCRSGNRSGQVTKFLNNNGYNGLNMNGGMIQWNGIK